MPSSPAAQAAQAELVPVDALIDEIRTYNPRTDVDLIRRAYDFAAHAHGSVNQRRKSGEPYFTHPIAVAILLIEQRLDDATIVTALLHDTVEDTRATYKQVADEFGTEIAELVNGVTKLTKMQLRSRESKQAENFRKLFMATSKDLRVLLVKLADRLHNMRTIGAMSPEKQAIKAQETMDIYAPLAGRMGMQSMREELEDHAFKILQPDARISIMRRFIKLRDSRGDVITIITKELRRLLSEAGIDARVYGREKKPFSIWRKLEQKGEAFHRLSDIYGFRVITQSEADCYKALGIVHGYWASVPGRFKDYISQPKSNGYRSIHTTVYGFEARRVEIQIRTVDMHEVAETGIAAHWAYRDGQRINNPFAADPVRWLQELSSGAKETEDADEFMEHVRLEMFTDQVFCFTPKGEVIKLPRGASPIDFAYAIHTKVGNHCVGAKADGQRIPLYQRLRNGQSVEILTAPAQEPQPLWLNFSVTGRARSAIRRQLRTLNRNEMIARGRDVARVGFEEIGKDANENALANAAAQLGFDNAEEVLVALGSGATPVRRVVEAAYPELMRALLDGDEDDPSEDGIIGPQGVRLKLAECCRPVPGERIIGIRQNDHLAQVHLIDCPTLEGFDSQPGLWVDLAWGQGIRLEVHSVRLEITMANNAGVLGRICTLIGESNANILDVRLLERKADFYTAMFEVEVRDVRHLHHITTALGSDSAVTQVARKTKPVSNAS